jgi:hypothetical protein
VGKTWTAADINASDFGVVFSATNPNTAHTRNATVDYMRITDTWSKTNTTIYGLLILFHPIPEPISG